MTQQPPRDVLTLAEEGVEIPLYASDQAAGADVRAFLKDNLVLQPGASALVPTGLRVAIPAGYERSPG